MVSLRGMSPEDAQARVDAQASREERLAVATYVVDNTGTLEELRDRVHSVYAELAG
jgi:dephospho-CoA kinase